MNNLILDDLTVEDIIRIGYTYKDKKAGELWTKRTLSQKARREVELEQQAKEAEKRAKIRQFKEKECSADRISRTDEQKEKSAKIYATKYGLNLDELLDIQKQAYLDEVKRTEESIDNAFEEVVDFGFEMER